MYYFISYALNYLVMFKKKKQAKLRVCWKARDQGRQERCVEKERGIGLVLAINTIIVKLIRVF